MTCWNYIGRLSSKLPIGYITYKVLTTAEPTYLSFIFIRIRYRFVVEKCRTVAWAPGACRESSVIKQRWDKTNQERIKTVQSGKLKQEWQVFTSDGWYSVESWSSPVVAGRRQLAECSIVELHLWRRLDCTYLYCTGSVCTWFQTLWCGLQMVQKIGWSRNSNQSITYIRYIWHQHTTTVSTLL